MGWGDFRTKIFADGAALTTMVALAWHPRISGFTTNPTLMRQAGLTEYRDFAQKLLEILTEHPVSLEVCADDALTIRRQAHTIATWGEKVFVKVPGPTPT